MHTLTLKAKVTQNGQPYAKNRGIDYESVSDAQVQYVLSKGAEIVVHLDAHKGRGGAFEVTLESDLDGKPVAPAYVKGGLSLAQWLDVEQHMIDIQYDMHKMAVRVAKAAGKL